MKMYKILFIVLITISISSCGWLKGGDKSQSVPELDVYSDVQQRRTSNSPLVLSKNGVSDEYLRWVDESLRELSFDITAQNRQYNINPSESSIYVLHNCVLSPESQTPGFLVRADDYDGTEFDQDPTPGVGKIYAAEKVIKDFFGGLTNAWIVCQSNDEVYVKNATRYGNEHVFLYKYYPNEYDATKFHGNGGPSHPLIPHR